MRSFLQKIMAGRYGPDNLGTVTLIVSILLSIVARFPYLGFVAIISYLLLASCIIRLLSRNIEARRRENDKFLRFWSPIKTKVKRFFKTLKERRTHHFFKCPSCHNVLRVPKGKGKLQITCPKCGERFIKKS